MTTHTFIVHAKGSRLPGVARRGHNSCSCIDSAVTLTRMIIACICICDRRGPTAFMSRALFRTSVWVLEKGDGKQDYLHHGHAPKQRLPCLLRALVTILCLCGEFRVVPRKDDRQNEIGGSVQVQALRGQPDPQYVPKRYELSSESHRREDVTVYRLPLLQS